jgi:hypothetical protein
MDKPFSYMKQLVHNPKCLVVELPQPIEIDVSDEAATFLETFLANLDSIPTCLASSVKHKCPPQPLIHALHHMGLDYLKVNNLPMTYYLVIIFPFVGLAFCVENHYRV